MSEASVSRRRFLGAAGAAGAGALVASAALSAATSVAAPRPRRRAESDVPRPVVPFHGAHQAGIVTPVQDRLLFAAFDLTTDEPRRRCATCCASGPRAARRMTAGRSRRHGQRRPRGAARRHRRRRRPRPGRAHRHVRFRRRRSSSATATTASASRAQRRPHWCDLPLFAGDEIDPARSDGDLLVQACANDPQVCFHAIRNLARIGRGTSRSALVAARLRPHVEHRRGADDAAEPHGVQGRHQQHRRRGHGRARPSTCGSADRDDPAWMRERHLRRDAPDPHAARGVGPLDARRPGATIGRVKTSGAPLGGRRGARPGRPEGAERRRVGDPDRRAHPPGGAGDQRRCEVSCGAGTRSPTGSTP